MKWFCGDDWPRPVQRYEFRLEFFGKQRSSVFCPREEDLACRAWNFLQEPFLSRHGGNKIDFCSPSLRRRPSDSGNPLRRANGYSTKLPCARCAGQNEPVVAPEIDWIGPKGLDLDQRADDDFEATTSKPSCQLLRPLGRPGQDDCQLAWN